MGWIWRGGMIRCCHGVGGVGVKGIVSIIGRERGIMNHSFVGGMVCG